MKNIIVSMSLVVFVAILLVGCARDKIVSQEYKILDATIDIVKDNEEVNWTDLTQLLQRKTDNYDEKCLNNAKGDYICNNVRIDVETGSPKTKIVDPIARIFISRTIGAARTESETKALVEYFKGKLGNNIKVKDKTDSRIAYRAEVELEYEGMKILIDPGCIVLSGKEEDGVYQRPFGFGKNDSTNSETGTAAGEVERVTRKYSDASRNQYRRQTPSIKQENYLSFDDRQLIEQAKKCQAIGRKMEQYHFPSYEYSNVRDNEYTPALNKYEVMAKRYKAMYGDAKLQVLRDENGF